MKKEERVKIEKMMQECLGYNRYCNLVQSLKTMINEQNEFNIIKNDINKGSFSLSFLTKYEDGIFGLVLASMGEDIFTREISKLDEDILDTAKSFKIIEDFETVEDLNTLCSECNLDEVDMIFNSCLCSIEWLYEKNQEKEILKNENNNKKKIKYIVQDFKVKTEYLHEDFPLFYNSKSRKFLYLEKDRQLLRTNNNTRYLHSNCYDFFNIPDNKRGIIWSEELLKEIGQDGWHQVTAIYPGQVLTTIAYIDAINDTIVYDEIREENYAR